MKKLTTGQTVRIIRLGQGIKQGPFEKAVGLPQGKLSGIEVHNDDFKVTELERICKELKTSPEEFFKIKGGLL